jgi:hypothetical protein
MQKQLDRPLRRPDDPLRPGGAGPDSARRSRSTPPARTRCSALPSWRSPPIIRWRKGPQPRRIRLSPPSSTNAPRRHLAGRDRHAEKKGFDTGIRVTHPARSGLGPAGLYRQLRADGLRHRRHLRLPGGDQRDLDFARKYGLPVRPSCMPGRRRRDLHVATSPTTATA